MQSINVEVCQWENFSPSCSGDSVIIIDHAQYGRHVSHLGANSRQEPDPQPAEWSWTGENRCIDKAYGSTDCLTVVTPYVASRCSGRRRCVIGLPDATLERSPHGCPRDLKANLAVSYRCLSGAYRRHGSIGMF